MNRPLLAAALVLSLAGCDRAAPESDDPAPGRTPAPASAPASAPAAVAVAAPAAFAQCSTCHQVAPGRHGVGPSLAGIHGRPAGGVPGYAPSAAMKASGLTWDDDTLDRYLEAPMAVVPGTKMVYPGIKDPARRAEVIAYLKSV